MVKKKQKNQRGKSKNLHQHEIFIVFKELLDCIEYDEDCIEKREKFFKMVREELRFLFEISQNENYKKENES